MSVGWSGGVAKKSGICSSSSSGGTWEGTGPEVIPFVSLPSMIWGSSGRRDGVNGNLPPVDNVNAKAFPRFRRDGLLGLGCCGRPRGLTPCYPFPVLGWGVAMQMGPKETFNGSADSLIRRIERRVRRMPRRRREAEAQSILLWGPLPIFQTWRRTVRWKIRG